MGEPSNPTKQPHILDAIRTLLQDVQSPLTTWSELLDAAAGVLADLDPPLDLVAFSPFAVLRTPAIVEPPPASQPLPRQRVAPAPPTAAITASTTKPVFALPPHKRASTAAAPTVVQNTATAAVALAQGYTGQQQTAPGGQDSAAVQALLTTVTQVATLTDTLLTGSLAAGASSVVPLSVAHPPSADNSGVPTPLAVADGAFWQTIMAPATVATADGALAETMARLAGLTDTLLTSPNAENAAQTALHMPEKGVLSSASTAPLPSRPEQQVTGFGGTSTWPTAAKTAHTQAPLSPPTPTTAPGIATEAVRGGIPFPEETEPRVMLTGALAASPARSVEARSFETLTGGPLAPPDAWTLAQLINDVLAEEARRHGVDLS